MSVLRVRLLGGTALVATILLAASALSGGTGKQPGQTMATAASAPRHVWLGPDGKPLPFKNDAEILDFLRTANVIADKGIPQGITGPRRLLLEKDGVRAEAVWREVNEEKMSERLASGQTEAFFRDSYIFEPAAYELSRLLGMDNVPPATLRRYKGNEGSIQMWVEQATTEMDRVKKKSQPPDVIHWSKQTHVMNLWDQLVYNTDRNQGNILVTPDWKMWFIDHTRAFRRMDYLLDQSKIRQCDRIMFEKLKVLDGKTLHEHLDPYLRKIEIEALLKRRDLVIKKLNQFIAEKGENRVLFTLYAPDATVEKAQ